MKTRKKIQFAIFFISVLMTFGACTGDEGPMGPAGPEGPAGQVGPAGADGSVLYSGTDDPLSVTGQDGDYYLNITSGELFGPKTAGEWTDSFMLKGEDGTDGADGNTILSGTETPGQTTGLEGDFYLDTDDILLYGPKVNDAWGAGLELKGADGSANVKSYILTITSDDWEPEYFEMVEIYTKKVPFPTLTSAIHNDGAVLIYRKTSTVLENTVTTTYSILPVTDIIDMGQGMGQSRSLKCDITETVINTTIPFISYFLDFTYQFSPIMELGIQEDLTVKIVLIQGEHAELAKKLQDQGLAKIASEIGFTL